MKSESHGVVWVGKILEILQIGIAEGLDLKGP